MLSLSLDSLSIELSSELDEELECEGLLLEDELELSEPLLHATRAKINTKVNIKAIAFFI